MSSLALNFRQLEFIACTFDPVCQLCLKLFPLVVVCVQEREVQGFVGILVEVEHDEWLAFQADVLPAVVCAYATPRTVDALKSLPDTLLNVS